MQNNIMLVHSNHLKPSGPIVDANCLPPIECHFEVNLIDNFRKSDDAAASTQRQLIMTQQRERNHRQYKTAIMNKKRENNNRCFAQWLFFNDSRWIPLDLVNNEKLENTILIRGTFIDIQDSHFPEVRKVRVFPELDYLSYLGIRYRLSKVLLPYC